MCVLMGVNEYSLVTVFYKRIVSVVLAIGYCNNTTGQKERLSC